MSKIKKKFENTLYVYFTKSVWLQAHKKKQKSVLFFFSSLFPFFWSTAHKQRSLHGLKKGGERKKKSKTEKKKSFKENKKKKKLNGRTLQNREGATKGSPSKQRQKVQKKKRGKEVKNIIKKKKKKN